ncbi:hypothetical protein MW887_012005 [Aspergillus wentii]|nr:hypothetical protein MW887_012005 [Aspergillus wentii]
MSSYADAAAKGPKQSAEEPAQVYRDESEGAASLIDVDSPHVASVESSFLEQDVKTTTQAERLEREAKEEEDKKAQEKKRKAKAKAKAEDSGLFANKGNPVVLGNALLITLASAGLGYGAYRKHLEGQLSWQIVGWASGAVGAFGAVDYLVSKWLFQNKYPRK